MSETKKETTAANTAVQKKSSSGHSSHKKKHKSHDSVERVSRLVNGKNVSYRVTEAYKTTRTNVLFALPKKDGCRILALTSAVPGEGKTTSTLNLAITFAMMDARVLVIDADLRKPKIHKYGKVDNSNGLANYLGGFCTLDEAIQHSDELGMDCMPSGSIPPNPAELLSSQQFRDGLEEMSARYDFIFIDTPPINSVTDGTIISELVEAMIVVIRHRYTAHEALKKALDTLKFANAKILGFILNDAEETAEGYKYKYRYRYRYGYGRYYHYRYYSYKDYREKGD